MTLWIRADGNEEIASGHLRRTLTIAQALRQRGVETLFLLSDEESRDVLLQLTDGNRTGWKYLLLGCAYGDLSGDLTRMRELLRAGAPDWLVVDSYAATAEYYEALKERTSGAAAGSSADVRPDTASSELPARGCRVACLDDLMAFDPPVDLVINYAPDAQASEAFYHHASVKLLGARYAPLRTQFSGIEPVVRRTVSRVLISTGGSDPYGMADAAAQAVLAAVSGRDGTGDRARSACARNEVLLSFAAPGHPYVSNMAGLLKKCDLAVSAGGTTLYELCAAGVPAIAFSMAENQKIFAMKMAAAGACTYAGDVRDPGERHEVLRRVGRWTAARCLEESGYTLRQRESERMHRLTDGSGAERIADTLLAQR